MNEQAKFKAYLKVQKGGKTNMFDVGMVRKLSGFLLTKEEIMDIMERYEALENLYPETVKEIFG